MPYTDDELNDATQRFEQLLDDLDPETTEAQDTTDLRAIAETVDAINHDRALLRERVALARARNRSWSEIGIALGVSRQAARERFAGKVDT